MKERLVAAIKPGRWPSLHPFLLASYSSLTLVANNLGEIDAPGNRLVALSMLAAGLVYLVSRFFTREWVRSGAIASGTVLIFFSYGHVLNVLSAILPGMELDGVLFVLWVALFVILLYWMLGRRPTLAGFSGGLTVIAAALNLFPLFSIVTFSGREASLHEVMVDYAEQGQITNLQLPQGAHPDVYYVILDAYGRADVLRDLYHYDNSSFVADLESRGFHVDPQATTNYTHSEISMASSLNMRYFDDLIEALNEAGIAPEEGAIRQASAELIRLSAVREAFESIGYTSVAFDSGYNRTRMETAQVFVQSPEIETVSSWQLGMELMLLDSSMGRGLVNLLGPERSPHTRLFEAHRQRVLYTLDHLVDFAKEDGDYFVFAHVISPHVPFVFDANGDPVPNTDPYTLLDARGGDPANIDLYTDQLQYLNTRVLAAVDAILENSRTPPIIILQADHGSKVYSESDPPLEIKMRLFLPMLNAIHAEGVDLYPGMTPVNTFRKIFDEVFGGEIELAQDSSYFLNAEDGTWQFVDACTLYPACATLTSSPDS